MLVWQSGWTLTKRSLPVHNPLGRELTRETPPPEMSSCIFTIFGAYMPEIIYLYG